MTPEEMKAWVAASKARQGLQIGVHDPETLARLAVLFAPTRKPEQPKRRRRRRSTTT